MSDAALREKLATSTRILAMQGLLGLFGHISVYQPDTKRVFLSPGAGSDKATVQAKDILIADIRRPRSGRRSSSHRMADSYDVTRHACRCVVGVSSSCAACDFVCNCPAGISPGHARGVMFGDGIPLYTETQLVMTVDHGQRLAKLIGSKRAALLRSHGIIVVGRDIDEALYASVVLEDEARNAMEAAVLGELQMFTPEECRNINWEENFPRRARRAWRYFAAQEARCDRQVGTGRAPLS